MYLSIIPSTFPNNFTKSFPISPPQSFSIAIDFANSHRVLSSQHQPFEQPIKKVRE